MAARETALRERVAWGLAAGLMLWAVQAGAANAACRVLLFTRTEAFRHDNLGPALGPGLNPPLADANVVQKGMLALAGRHGWSLDYTEDLARLSDLRGYAAVIFFSTSGEALDDRAEAGLRRYMRARGGFVAIHNALIAPPGRPFYARLLGGGRFHGHGPLRTGEVTVVDRRDASTRSLPPRFAFRDEWYALEPPPTGVDVLATARSEDGASNRPVAWRHRYGGGGAWATTLGHDAGVFSSNGSFPGATEFQNLVAGGVRSVATPRASCG